MINFHQDEVPALPSAMARQLREEILSHFIRKDEWLGDKPELDPTENLFSSMDKTNLNSDQEQLEALWMSISNETL